MKTIVAAVVLVAAVAMLSASAAPVGEKASEDFPIRVNQAGYLPRAPKWCAMWNPPKATFLVQRGDTDIHWHTVYEGKWVDAPSGGGLKLGDFSCITEPGDYRILCGELKGNEKFRMPDWRPAIQSFHFPVREGVYDVAERLLVMYITMQRCGSKKGWAGLCHMDPVPVKDATGATVRHIDAHGGYHQSNDLRNWHDGISLSMYTLLRYAELKKPLWDDGEIAEEIRWGCDYFLRVIAPEGYVYDAQFAPIGWQPRDYYLAPAALGAQCNVAMLLSRASRFFRPSDAAYADRLLAAARRVWNAIETNPFFEKAQPSPAKNLPAGAQPAERFYFQQWRTSVNGISERAMAALDLYLATGEQSFADKAKALGAEMVAHLAREGENAGWYMAEDGTRALRDCSYCTRASGFRVPIELYRTFGGAMWKDAALCVAERIARNIEKGDNWNADRNACKGPPLTQSFDTCYLLDCAELFGRGDFFVWAQRSFDWIFGMNLWNASYVECVGQNQWQRPVFGQFFPSTPQIPGGVLHTSHGEYDMPPVAATLFASARLGSLCGAGTAAPKCDLRGGTNGVRIETGKGFFLNGAHRQMKGVCLHHDLGPVGAAFDRDFARRQLALLKEMGCDAIRTSHNPPAAARPIGETTVCSSARLAASSRSATVPFGDMTKSCCALSRRPLPTVVGD